MATSSSIDILFFDNIDPMLVIDRLLNEGWSFNDGDHITYLPLGDSDDFDWQWANLEEWKSVYEVLKYKASKDESIGLAISWKETKIGGELVIWSNKNSISFILNTNRKNIEKLRHKTTDYSWYLERILAPIIALGIRIEKINCEQF
jgi:hypothetical protein